MDLNIGNNIRNRRLELGVSQEDLAAALGYRSRSSIAKIESGDTDISLSKLLELAEALDIGASELLEGSVRTPAALAQIPRVGGQGERRIAALVLAGGKSTRNLQNIPNQFVNVLGKPVIAYCLEVYQRHPLIDDVYVVCSDGWESIVSTYATRFGIAKFKGVARAGSSGVRSVRNGVVRLSKEGYGAGDLVVLQEATRPFVTEDMVSSVLAEASKVGNAITGERMGDNVQFLVVGESTSYIERNSVVDLQSPDAYTVDYLDEVFGRAEQKGNSQNQNCMGLLMDELGYHLNFCYGARGNMKIVRPEDIAVFTALAKQRL